MLKTHRSFRMVLFSFFHCSLKSEVNSCHTENSVLGETSFSPDLGFTEKNTTSCRNLEVRGHGEDLRTLNRHRPGD